MPTNQFLYKNEYKSITDFETQEDSPRLALKSLVIELYKQGICVSDIAKVLRRPRQSVYRWIFEDAFPTRNNINNGCFDNLLRLHATYRDIENRILVYLLKHKKMKASDIAYKLKIHFNKIYIHLDNLLKRGLVKKIGFFRIFTLTPKGIAEAILLEKSGITDFPIGTLERGESFEKFRRL